MPKALLFQNYRRRSLMIAAGLLATMLIVVVVSVLSPKVLGVAKTWSGGGADNNWSTAGNWTPSGAPATGDTVTFDGTSSKNATIDASAAASVASITISSGYNGTITLGRTFTIGALSQSSGIFTNSTFSLGGNSFVLNTGGTFTGGSGTINFSTTFTQNGGAFTASSTTTSVASTFTVSGGTFAHNSGTFDFRSSLSATLSCNNVTFNRVTISGSAAGIKTVSSDCTFPLGASPTVSNALVLNGTLTGTGTLGVTGNSFTWNSTGVLTGFTGINANTNVSIVGATVNLSTYTTQARFGALSMSSGTLTFPSSATSGISIGSLALSGGTFNASSGTMTIGGNISITGSPTFNANGGSITLSGFGGTTLACGNVAFNNIVLSQSNNDLTIGSDCSLPLGANPTITSNSSDNIITLNGTLSGSGTLTMSRNGLTMNSTAVLTGFSGLAANASLTIQGPTPDFSGYSSFSAGTLTLTSGSITLPSTASTTSLAISGGTFNAPSGVYSVTANLTFSGSPTINNNGGTFNFSGSTGTLSCNNYAFNAVTFTGQTNTKTVNSNCNLPVGSNPTIPSSVVLNGTLTGTGTITFTAGTLTLNSTAVLSGFTGLSGNGMTVAGATANFSGYSSGFSLGSTYNQTSGTVSLPNTGSALQFLLSGGTFNAPSGIFTVSSTFTISGAPTFNANGGTVVFAGSTATLTCNNVTFSTVGFAGQTATKTVTSSCSLPLGANPTIPNNIALSGTLSGTGTITHTTGTLTLNSGSSLSGFTGLTGTSNQLSILTTVDFSAYTSVFNVPNGIVMNNTGVLTLPDGAVIGSLSVTQGSVLATTGSYSITSLNLSNTGIFTAPTGILNVTGSFTVSGTGTFNHNNGAINFTGSSITPTCTNAVFNLVTINNTGLFTVNSGCSFPLGANPTVANSLTINGGTLSGSGTLTQTTGTFVLNSGYTFTGFSGFAPSALLVAGATANFGSYTTFAVANNISVTSGALTMPPGATVGTTFALTGGTATGTTGNITIAGAFSLSSGTFTAPSGTLSIGGNFTHTTGTFTHNSGTVNFNGSTSQSITGTNTFYNLTKVLATPGAQTLTLPSSLTQTVLNTLTLQGYDASNLLSLRSSNTNTQWRIDPQGTRSSLYLDVKDANNTNASLWLLGGTGSTDSGNNTNVNFGNFTPDVPSSLGPTNYVNGSTASVQQPTLTFNLTDTNNPVDTLKYQIQIDNSSDFSSPVVDYTSALGAQGSRNFTVGQATSGGSYADGSSGQSLGTTSYYWRVRATDNGALTSAYTTANSGAVAFIVATVPGTPASLNATPGNTQVTLTWSAPSTGGSAITDYIVEYKLSADSSWTVFADGISGSTGATVTGLTNGSAYNFRVSATNLVGTGNVSTTATTTPRTVPSAPTIGFAVGGDSSAQVTFSGNSNGGATITGYTATSSPGGITGTGASSPITVSGLTNGTSYTFTVTATNAAGTSSASAASNSVTPAQLPGIPQNLVATPASGQVGLTWDAPANNGGSSIFDYQVEYKTQASSSWTVFAHGTSTNLFATVTGLSNGTTYNFRVSSVNAVGSGTPSNVATATPANVPGAPTSLIATGGSSQVSLSWTAPGSNGGSAITDYLVEYKLTSDSSWSTFSDGVSTTTSTIVTSLTNALSYDFRVSAINAIGTSTASSTASATPTSIPAAPTIGTATRGNGQASITFTANSDGGSAITSFTMTSTPGNITASGSSSPIVVTGLTNGVNYTFKVYATNAFGNSPQSAASNSVIPATVPGAPTGLNATAGDTQVALSWTAPASNGGTSVTDYVVEYKLTSDSSWTVFADGVSNSAAATVTGLTDGLSYDFRVSAVNAVGTGTTSTTTSATPIGFPGAPTSLIATYGNTQVSLSWTAPVSDGGYAITDYKVEYKPANNSSWIVFNDGVSTTTSAVVTGLVNGVSYGFRVSTITVVTGSPSTTASAVPKTTSGAPAIGTATKGNGLAVVTFTAPASNGGSVITGYTVTSSPGSLTAAGSSSPITVSGLTNGIAYTFTVVATNAVGDSTASGASNSVTPTAVPDAPTGLSLSRGSSGQLIVTFTPGSDNGSAITSYTVASSPDNISASGATSPITVSGLTNGRSYTFTMYATNVNGNSLTSTASASLAPATIPGAPPIGTATAGNAQATVRFSAPSSNGGASVSTYTATSNPGNISVSGNSSPISITGLTNGVTYTFTVTATNTVGTGPASSPSNSVTPSGATTVPGQVGTPIATAGYNQVGLDWSAPTNGGSAITDYIIEYKLATDSSWSVFSDGVSTSSATTVTGLTNDVTYNFRVSAVNAVGTGAVSGTASAIPNIGAAVETRVLPGSSDSGYFTKVISKADGLPLIAYYDSGLLKEDFVGCNDANCNSYTTADSGINPVGYWGLLYIKSDDMPSYISKDISLQGTISRYDCSDANCTGGTFTSALFPATGGNYGPVVGAIRPNGKPFMAMDGVAGMGGILDSFSCADETCSSGTRRTLDSNGAGVNPSVAVLADNRPVVSYYDNTNYALKLYVCANADCTSGSALTLHAGSASAHYGEESSVVIRNDGTPGIVYSGPDGLHFYDCPNSECSGGAVSTNSYSVHDEATGATTALSNASGSVVQLDTDGNPVIMSSGARGKGSGNVSVYKCYDPKCAEGRFRTLISTADNNGGFPSFLVRADGGYTIAYHDYTTKKAVLYNYLPTNTSSISNLSGSLDVGQISRQNVNVTQSSSYSDPQTQNFSSAVVDVRLLTSGGIPLSDVVVSFNTNGNMNWGSVTGSSDAILGKAVIANLGTAPGAASTHTLYVPKRSQDGGVHICPSAVIISDVTTSCSGGYTLSANGGAASVVTIDGNTYWKITGLSGTGGIGVPLINGGIGLTLTPNNVGVSSGTDIVAHWTPSAELASTNTAAVDFPSGFTLANTCSVPTIDADANGITDGSGTITTDGSGNPRYLYTFSAATTLAGTSGLSFCIHVTASSISGNYQVDAFDYLGGFGSALLYVGNENQVNVTATVDNTLSFSIRNSGDTADLGNLGSLSFGPNICDLGILSTAGVQTCSYRLKVATNAANGYSVNIATDGSLRKADNSAYLPNIISGNTVTSGIAGYGISLDGGQATGGIGGITEGGSFNTDDSPTATAVTTGISATLYSSNTVNNPASTDTVNTALVTHRAEADASTPAGTYAQMVTYTVSASF